MGVTQKIIDFAKVPLQRLAKLQLAMRANRVAPVLSSEWERNSASAKTGGRQPTASTMPSRPWCIAEVAVSREVFRQVLERIAGLHPAPG